MAREFLQPLIGELAIAEFCNQQLQKCRLLPAELRPVFSSNEELVRRAQCRDGGATGTGGWIIVR